MKQLTLPLGAPCVVGIQGEHPCLKPASKEFVGYWVCADHARAIETQGKVKR